MAIIPHKIDMCNYKHFNKLMIYRGRNQISIFVKVLILMKLCSNHASDIY